MRSQTETRERIAELAESQRVPEAAIIAALARGWSFREIERVARFRLLDLIQPKR